MLGNYIWKTFTALILKKSKIELDSLTKDSALCYNYSFGPIFN